MGGNTSREAEGNPDQPGLKDEEGNRQHVTGQERSASTHIPKSAQPGMAKNQKKQYKRYESSNMLIDI